MNFKLKKATTGTGVLITLTGDELARAIDAFLVSHGVMTRGPRTIRANGELCEHASIFVDPSGFVIENGTMIRGGESE